MLEYLCEIGLNEKEAAVYLALLQYDNASIIDIASKTKIKRSTTYTVIESLMKKGLVSETTVGKKTRYQAEAPERLETFVERQKIELEEHSKRLKDIIPQIKSVQRESGEKPLVKYLEGKDGVMTSLEEFFKSIGSDPEMYVIYSRDLLQELFSDADRIKFKNARRGKNVASRAVYNSLKGDLPDEPDARRIRLDSEKYPILCDIGIYGDEVRISTLKKFVSAIVIKNKDLATTLKSLINYILDQKK